jgi:hypothetical protein
VEEAKTAGFDFQPERRRLRETGTLRLRRGLFQLDLILASLPFEDAAFRRSFRKRLFGRTVHLPTPEDLILFKVLAGRDKDLLDAVGVARRHFARLDRAYLERTMQELCELAQDMAPWRRLKEMLEKASAL